jgi:hypothetical protein
MCVLIYPPLVPVNDKVKSFSLSTSQLILFEIDRISQDTFHEISIMKHHTHEFEISADELIDITLYGSYLKFH